MKKFEDLSESELVALTEDDVKRYADYACAEHGIPLLPAMPDAPRPVEFEPDMELFSVGHYLHFRTAEAAAKAMDAILAAGPVETAYLSTPSHVTSTAVSASKPYLTITSQKAFSVELAAQLKADMEGAQRAEAIHLKAQKDYDAAVMQRSSVVSEIREAIDLAYAAQRERETVEAAYARYLDLADGSADIARRFLRQAYPQAETLLPHLFQLEA